MEPQIEIGEHAFTAYSLPEAIAQAVEKARALREAGELEAAQALYAVAEQLRRVVALGPPPAARGANRTTERWQRRVGMLHGARRR